MTAYTTSVGGSVNETLIRENLENYITLMDPTDAPLTAFLEPVPMASRIIEFPVDNLGLDFTTAPASEAVAEASDFSEETPAYPSRLRAVAQINKRGLKISGSDRAHDHAGIGEPFQYRLWKAMQVVIQQQEKAMLLGVGSDPNASTRLTQGIIHWCAFSGLERATAATPATTLTSTHGETIANDYFSYMANALGTNLSIDVLTYDILGAASQIPTVVGQGVFNVEGAVGMCSLRLKGLLGRSTLQLNEKQINAWDKAFVDVVDFYDTVAGGVWINRNRHMDLATSVAVDNTTGGLGEFNSTVPVNETIIFMQPKFVKRGVLRGLHMEPMGKGGDWDAAEVRAEGGLIVTHPIGLCGGTNLIA